MVTREVPDELSSKKAVALKPLATVVTGICGMHIAVDVGVIVKPSDGVGDVVAAGVFVELGGAPTDIVAVVLAVAVREEVEVGEIGDGVGDGVGWM